ncbi:MAG: hypothetical protein AAFX57_16220 [Bacteroidota bacterium]
MNNISWGKVEELGFVAEHDGTGDPRGTDYNMRIGDFHLWVDAWFEVYLTHGDSDQVQLKVDDEFELIQAINLIGGEVS